MEVFFNLYYKVKFYIKVQLVQFLTYNLIDIVNVEVTSNNGQTKIDSIYFEYMIDKFKLEYNENVYYRAK